MVLRLVFQHHNPMWEWPLVWCPLHPTCCLNVRKASWERWEELSKWPSHCLWSSELHYLCCWCTFEYLLGACLVWDKRLGSGGFALSCATLCPFPASLLGGLWQWLVCAPMLVAHGFPAATLEEGLQPTVFPVDSQPWPFLCWCVPGDMPVFPSHKIRPVKTMNVLAISCSSRIFMK